MLEFPSKSLVWINKPKDSTVEQDKIVIVTKPKTDLWQRTYYGFQNDNAPILCMEMDESFFTFSLKAEFDYKQQFDQCGVAIYQDSDNWFKASIEYETGKYQRLGSVVTNQGFSDWATTDIPADIQFMYYRLSRRNSDFCIESSRNGVLYQQMRIFHLFRGQGCIRLGLYACSPAESSFRATFTEMKLSPCLWDLHH